MFLNKKGKVPNQAHVGIPEGLCEEEHGREGFAGPVSHLYRTHPPTGWVKIEGPLKPRAFACTQVSMTMTTPLVARPVLVMQSENASLYLSRHTETMVHFIRNADGDEVYFVHQGTGKFETDYGTLPYEPGDYVVIPKGTREALVRILDFPASRSLCQRVCGSWEELLGTAAHPARLEKTACRLDGSPYCEMHVRWD